VFFDSYQVSALYSLDYLFLLLCTGTVFDQIRTQFTLLTPYCATNPNFHVAIHTILPYSRFMQNLYPRCQTNSVVFHLFCLIYEFIHLVHIYSSYNRFESNRNIPTCYLILNLPQGTCDILRGQPTCQTSFLCPPSRQVPYQYHLTSLYPAPTKPLPVSTSRQVLYQYHITSSHPTCLPPDRYHTSTIYLRIHYSNLLNPSHDSGLLFNCIV